MEQWRIAYQKRKNRLSISLSPILQYSSLSRRSFGEGGHSNTPWQLIPSDIYSNGYYQ
jgi:hypothetical protein